VVQGPFRSFLFIVVLFTLGNSSDAFLILRAEERGLSVVSILAMVATFNGVYALVSGPAGAFSDRVGRRRLIVGGWLMYGLIYLGLALPKDTGTVWPGASGRCGRCTPSIGPITAWPRARPRHWWQTR
jgi:MFS family permease